MQRVAFDLTQYLLVGVILLASSIVQGAVGFAAGLFGIPLLMLTGMSLPSAVAISLVASAVQNVTAAWQMRREVNFRRALRPMLIRFATLPLGVAALYYVGSQHKDHASQVVGIVVLAIVILQWSLKVTPQQSLHVAWEWLAFGIGGFLLGLCGMGGPPMVLWVLAHDWTMQRARAFLYFIFATGLPLQALLMWWVFGHEMLEAMLLGLLGLPFLLVGILVGLSIGKRIPDQVLRQLSLVVLLLIALSAILTPYL